MSDEGIIEFDKVKGPHAFRRKERKVAAIKKAFKAARKPDGGKPAPKRKRKKKK